MRRHCDSEGLLLVQMVSYGMLLVVFFCIIAPGSVEGF